MAACPPPPTAAARADGTRRARRRGYQAGTLWAIHCGRRGPRDAAAVRRGRLCLPDSPRGDAGRRAARRRGRPARARRDRSRPAHRLLLGRAGAPRRGARRATTPPLRPGAADCSPAASTRRRRSTKRGSRRWRTRPSTSSERSTPPPRPSGRRSSVDARRGARRPAGGGRPAGRRPRARARRGRRARRRRSIRTALGRARGGHRLRGRGHPRGRAAALGAPRLFGAIGPISPCWRRSALCPGPRAAGAPGGRRGCRSWPTSSGCAPRRTPKTARRWLTRSGRRAWPRSAGVRRTPSTRPRPRPGPAILARRTPCGRRSRALRYVDLSAIRFAPAEMADDRRQTKSKYTADRMIPAPSRARR